VTESMWQRLLRTFLGMEVRMVLRGNKELAGTLEHLGDDGGRVRTPEGKAETFEYFDVRECEAI